MSKPSLPQGTRDFSPETVRKRNYILNTIKTVFELYGFQPLETPAMENLETLMGKYGEEGDKLIFRILNNGLGDPKNADRARLAFENVLAGKNDRNLTERALRYDLTIPLARYVAMNHGQLSFPFKRYQVQPVWRADRPQKGRYREFYQCDADVVGSRSLLNEVELALIYHEAFRRLGLEGVRIKINSRKILGALAEIAPGKMTDITVAIDKLDKIGLEKVKEELIERGLRAEQVAVIEAYLQIAGDNRSKLAQVAALLKGAAPRHLAEGSAERAMIDTLANSAPGTMAGAGTDPMMQAVADAMMRATTEAPITSGKADDASGSQLEQGIQELSYVLDRLPQDVPAVVDFTLARGLNYYTGLIFEVAAPLQVKMGSIGGGGRYDDLTGLFGVPNIPGVGISFGVDRIYDVMEELGLFPSELHISSQLLFLNNGGAGADLAFEMLQLLRGQGVRGELFHEPQKIDKQFKYAEKKNIPYVITTVPEEQQFKVKDTRSGEVVTVDRESLLQMKFG